MHDVEYLLRYLLGSTMLRLEKLEDISDMSQEATFKKKFEDTKRIRAFCTEISSETRFPMFGVPLSPDTTTHNAKLCEVAVGDPIYVSEEYAKQMNPPGRYDTFIINECGYQVGFLLDSQELDIKNYWYVVKDPSRIVPLFDVTFEYDAELEAKSRGCFVCDRCKMEQSVSFCPAERASFCQGCDADVHNDHFLRRHMRYYFNEVGKKKFIYCVIHPDTMVDYFCEECFIPVCTRCKISGNHSEPPNGTHLLLDYLEACDRLQVLLKESDCKFIEEERKFREKVLVLGGSVEQFQNTVNDVRSRIENEYRNVMNELSVLEKKELQAVNSQYISYICQLEELRRIREYPGVLEPSQLLKTFKNVVQQRESFEIPSQDVFFRPTEISLRGHLSVRDEEAYTVRRGYSPRMEKSTQLYVETRGIDVNIQEENK